MITKKQAMKLKHGDIVHYEGKDCQRIVGKRGGVTLKVVAFRVNGKLKYNKTSWSIPIKRGLYESGCIWYMRDSVNGDNGNHDVFHLASECPLEANRIRLTL